MLVLFVISSKMKCEKIIPLSQSSILLSFGSEINLKLHEQVMYAKHLIESNPFEGLIETVPAYNSLAVYYNPLQIKKTEETIAASVEQIIKPILETDSEAQLTKKEKIITIPVCYDPEFGIDIEELSTLLQLSTEQIIFLHTGKLYKVFMTGFTPGFPYMGTVDDQIITKRRSSPRISVEQGSVAIAGTQTGIYPLNTPGGWNIIGKIPLKLFDKTKKKPFLLKAGDDVRFERISKKEFENWEKK
jgi:inhibitor of KinA